MSSNVAEHVTTLYTLFEVPLISYLSSSPSLNIKDSNHPLARKTQPIDTWHMRALEKVLLYVFVSIEKRHLALEESTTGPQSTSSTRAPIMDNMHYYSFENTPFQISASVARR